MCFAVATDHDVLKHCHVSKQANILEGASDSGLTDFFRRVVQDTFAIKKKLSTIRGIKTREHIKQSGFSSTIGADDAINAIMWNGK